MQEPLINIEIEQQVLGVLLRAEGMEALIHPSAEDFFDPVHQRIFAAAMQRQQQDGTAPLHAVAHDLQDDAGLIELGGGEYLARLVAVSGTVFGYATYVKALQQLSRKRRLSDTLSDAQARLLSPDEDASAVVGMLETALASSADLPGAEIIDLSSAVLEAADQTIAARECDGVPGVTTGYKALDRITGGFFPGDFIVLGGRPGMGKSAVALSMALQAARAGRTVALASLEMAPSSMALRAMSEHTSRVHKVAVEYTRARRGDLSDRDMQAFFDGSASLARASLPISIIPPTCRDVGALTAAAKRIAKRQGGLSMLVVDYLQLLRSSKHSRYEQITEISMSLKALAMQLECPVLALSQLSRQVENREDKRPNMSDLRDSGQIEQDADTIIFAYREEYYLQAMRPEEGDKLVAWQDAMDRAKGRLDLIVSKQRMGETGTVTLRFTPGLNLVEDWSA